MRLGQTLPLLKENLSFLKFSFFLNPVFAASIFYWNICSNPSIIIRIIIFYQKNVFTSKKYYDLCEQNNWNDVVKHDILV